ncbi:MAG TPA: hypothetical protein PLU30_22990 [Verrucomicrobiae bacterium]|nr:hypothetical protein [Verrucomicrobiae bacterium]
MKSVLFVILTGLFLVGCASTPKCPAKCCGTCGKAAATQTECAK